MMKDAAQKTRAISFCAASGMIPFLEVVLRYEGDTDDAHSNITDLDVLGLQLSGADRLRRIIFDCKTLANVSPINRALWARGAMAFAHCNEAFVILKKKALDGHRLAAKNFGVHLFDDDLFDHYATATTTNYLKNPSYLCSANTWEQWARIPESSKRLTSLISYMSNVIPVEPNHLRALRSLVYLMYREAAGEFDPKKPAHWAVFYQYLSSLAICLSQVVGDLRNIFDRKMSTEAFDTLMKRYIWEGREHYEIRNRLHKASQQRGNSDGKSDDLSLPGWPVFLQMIRVFLDAPHHVSACALPLKEMAFRALAGRNDAGDMRLHTMLTNSNRLFQFSLQLSAYAVKSVSLPRDFEKDTATQLEEIRTFDAKA